MKTKIKILLHRDSKKMKSNIRKIREDIRMNIYYWQKNEQKSIQDKDSDTNEEIKMLEK